MVYYTCKQEILYILFVRGCSFCVKLLLQLMNVPLNVCVNSVRLMAPLNLPLSGALCGLIFKICFLLRLPKKNRPPVGSSAAEVDDYAI